MRSDEIWWDLGLIAKNADVGTLQRRRLCFVTLPWPRDPRQIGNTVEFANLRCSWPFYRFPFIELNKFYTSSEFFWFLLSSSFYWPGIFHIAPATSVAARAFRGFFQARVFEVLRVFLEERCFTRQETVLKRKRKRSANPRHKTSPHIQSGEKKMTDMTWNKEVKGLKGH